MTEAVATGKPFLNSQLPCGPLCSRSTSPHRSPAKRDLVHRKVAHPVSYQRLIFCCPSLRENATLFLAKLRWGNVLTVHEPSGHAEKEKHVPNQEPVIEPR